MAEEKNLPGWPSKKLVKDVKRTLWIWAQCRPQVTYSRWRLAWEWANKVRYRNELYDFSKRRRPKWPSPHEIASMYLWLCMVEMKSSFVLKLPYHAVGQIPESFKKELSLGAQPAIQRLEQMERLRVDELHNETAIDDQRPQAMLELID